MTGRLVGQLLLIGLMEVYLASGAWLLVRACYRCADRCRRSGWVIYPATQAVAAGLCRWG
jgi:hypothetical protein